MKKDHQHIEDFLEDKSFRNWVIDNHAEERLYWEKWIAANPDKVPVLLQAKKLLLDLLPDIQDWEKRRERQFYKRLEKSLANHPAKSTRLETYKDRTKKQPVQWPALVLVALALMVTGLWLFTYHDFLNWRENTITEDNSQAEAIWISKAVPSGQKSKLHLPDGSIITLNSSSEIKYKKGFGTEHRDIFLQGESFFEVTSDSLLPFRVFTGDIMTTALGTSFNILSYDEKELRIQLATGKVKVWHPSVETGADSTAIFLEPGEEVLLKNRQEWIRQKFNTKTAFLWKDGILYFDKTPFSEVIKTLEEWYGVEIKVKSGSHQNKLVTGRFKNDYLSNVLETIGYSIELDYKIKEKTVELYFKK